MPPPRRARSACSARTWSCSATDRAWDFVGSGLGGRNLLYERFYLTSAGRNRITAHVLNTDRERANGLVDAMLAAGRRPSR
jgi:hypothetical protein